MMQCPQCQATDAQVLGHEVPEIYDGVLYWSCMVCKVAWPRTFETPYRKVMSEVHAARHNKVREEVNSNG